MAALKTETFCYRPGAGCMPPAVELGAPVQNLATARPPEAQAVAKIITISAIL